MKKLPTVVAGALVGMLALAGCTSQPATSDPAGTASSVTAAMASAEAVAPAEAAPRTAQADAAAMVAPVDAASSFSASPFSEESFGAASFAAPATLTATGDPTKRLITAQGTGTVTGTPDVLTITIGVQTTSASAQTAIADNNQRATDTIALIKAAGVADADLQTSQLSISPNYNDQNTITGYQVSNMLTATLRDIGGAGGLIDAVAKAAGDAVRVQQLDFSIDNDSDLRAGARADAVRQAQAQAKQLADAAGVTLGPIDSITESAGSSPVRYSAAAATDAAAAMPIEPGSQELAVTVQVVYQIG